jgi:hypothetical protein
LTPIGFNQNINVEHSSSRIPYVNQWSLSVQHEFSSTVTAELDYFGSLGVKLSGQIIDDVASTPGTDSYKLRQPWPQLSPYVLNGYNEFNSWYDGLAGKVTIRAAHNLDVLADFTWSKTLDVEDSFLNGGSENPTRYTLSLNKGPAGFDIEHIVNLSYIYNVPFTTKSRVLNALVHGWSTSGAFAYRTGTPYYVTLGSDNENIGTNSGRTTEFPNLIGNPNSGFTQSLNRWFNTAAYALPPFGIRGDAGRHAQFTESFTNLNAALYKRWFFKETRSVELRGEAFNLPNSHYFNAPGAVYGTTAFGKVSGATSGRAMQVAVKVHF